MLTIEEVDLLYFKIKRSKTKIKLAMTKLNDATILEGDNLQDMVREVNFHLGKINAYEEILAVLSTEKGDERTEEEKRLDAEIFGSARLFDNGGCRKLSGEEQEELRKGGAR